MSSQTPMPLELASNVAQICSILAKLFIEKTRGQTLAATTQLVQDLSLDSLDLLTLIALVEDSAECALMDEQTDPSVFETIGSLALHLESMRRAQRGTSESTA
jgi:acyl carrier protein